MTHGAGAVPWCLFSAGQHLSFPGPSSTGVRGCLYLQALAAAPLPASSFWDNAAQTTSLPREHQERRVPGERGSWAEDWHCHSSTRGHCTSKRRGRVAPSFLCKLNHSPFFIYGPLTALCCASVVSTGSSKPSLAGPKVRLADSSSPAGLRLLPGATFPAFMTPTSLDAGVVHRAAVKQRLLPGPPRGSKQHINPL